MFLFHLMFNNIKTFVVHYTLSYNPLIRQPSPLLKRDWADFTRELCRESINFPSRVDATHMADERIHFLFLQPLCFLDLCPLLVEYPNPIDMILHLLIPAVIDARFSSESSGSAKRHLNQVRIGKKQIELIR